MLRRAVSSAYYALFHALVDEACRQMLGGRHDDMPFRHVLGRAFTHGTMKQACMSFAGGTLKATVAGSWKLQQIDPEGRGHDQGGRCTFAVCRMGNDWKIVSQHFSPTSAEEAAAE